MKDDEQGKGTGTEVGNDDQQMLAASTAESEHGQRLAAVQRSVAARLAAEPIASVSPHKREQLLGPAKARARQPKAQSRWRWPAVIGGSGWAVAAALAAWLLVVHTQAGQQNATPLIPMAEAVLTDFHERTAGALPLAPPDLAAFEAVVGFPISPLRAADTQLLCGWVTQIRDRPAVALAYQWQRRVIVQYFVPEELFFRQPQVRDAVAESGRYIVARERDALVGWASERAGVLVVGETTAAMLSALGRSS